MAGELRVSMLFQANAAQAKAEVAALRAETIKLGQGAASAGAATAAAAPQLGAVGAAANAAGTGMIAAADGTAEWGSYVQMIRAQLQPMIAEVEALASSQQQLALFEEMGALSAQEAALAHDVLSRKATELIDRMEAAGVSIDGTSVSLRRQDTAAQALINRMTGVSTATGETIADTLRHGQALDALRARYNPLFAASRSYERELHDIAEAEHLGAISAIEAAHARERAATALAPMPAQMGRIGAASQQATAYVGQLGYQFNDIGMMLAMGQSPFMLMVQQGPQVVQAFQGITAAGTSLGAGLKTAFLGMLSPMSLVTMGVIGLGSYAVQALMGMGEEAKSAEDAVNDVTSSVKAFADETRRSTDDIVADFGRINPKIIELQKSLTALAELHAVQDLQAAFKSLKGETEGGWLSSDAAQVGQLLGTRRIASGRLSNGRAIEADPRIAEMQGGLVSLQTANGPEAQLSIVRDLSYLLVEAAGGIGQMSVEQSAYYGHLLDTEAALNRIIAAQGAAARQKLLLDRDAGIDNDRMGGPAAIDRPKAIDPARAAQGHDSAAALIASRREELELARLTLAFGAQSAEVKAEEARQARAAVEAEIARLGIERQGAQAAQMRQQAVAAAALTEAQQAQDMQSTVAAMLAQHQQDAQIVALSAQYGADSLEVAYARVGAERQVYEAQLAAQGIVGETADELLRAWDAAEGIAAVNMAAGIGAAAGEAQLLAQALGISLAKAIGIMGLASRVPKITAPRVSFGLAGSAADGLIPGQTTGLSWGDNPGAHQSTATNAIPRIPSGAGAGKGGGGAGAASADKEASAVKRLVEEQRRQIEALRILDPVQIEIQKNHEALAKATTAERDQVIDLIKERMRLEEVRDRLQEIGQAGKNAFVGLVTSAMSFSDAISNVLMKLAEMAASSAWDQLWSGGSGGGGGLSGLLGDLFGLGGSSGGSSGGTGSLGLPEPFADGGHVSGVGGPREDNIAAWISVGEYIVNAEATRGALPLLEALNAGVPLDQLMDVIGGSRPSFADGGLFAPQASSPSAWFGSGARQTAGGGRDMGGAGRAPNGGGEVAVKIYFDSRKADWTAEVARISGEVATDAVIEGITSFSSHLLPDRMAEISDHPRTSG